MSAKFPRGGSKPILSHPSICDFFKNQPCDVSHAVHIKKQFNIMKPPQGFGETGGGGINETRKQMLNLFLGGHGNKEEYGEQWI